MHSLNNQMIMRTLTPGNGYHKANSETGACLMCCSRAEAGWETLKNVLWLQWYIHGNTVINTTLSNSWRGEKKRKCSYCSENSMWNLNILRLKDESNAVAHKAKPEWEGAGRNHRPSVPSAWSWKAAPVKPHLFPAVAFPEGSQAQEFKEEQESTSGSGRSSSRWRIMDVLLHWRGSGIEKPNTATSRM